jgi:hypothetical protein
MAKNKTWSSSGFLLKYVLNDTHCFIHEALKLSRLVKLNIKEIGLKPLWCLEFIVSLIVLTYL